jgi:hypothetical protein
MVLTERGGPTGITACICDNPGHDSARSGNQDLDVRRKTPKLALARKGGFGAGFAVRRGYEALQRPTHVVGRGSPAKIPRGVSVATPIVIETNVGVFQHRVMDGSSSTQAVTIGSVIGRGD